MPPAKSNDDDDPRIVLRGLVIEALSPDQNLPTYQYRRVVEKST
jgi:hypothetical protein